MQPHGDIVLNIGHVSLTLFKKSIEPSTVFCPIPNGWKLCRLQNYLGRMHNWAIENASAEALVPISNTRKENSKILFKKECSMTFKSTLFKNTKFVNIQCREELRNGPCDILFSLFLLEIIQTSVQFAMTSAILLLYFKIRDLKKKVRGKYFLNGKSSFVMTKLMIVSSCSNLRLRVLSSLIVLEKLWSWYFWLTDRPRREVAFCTYVSLSVIQRPQAGVGRGQHIWCIALHTSLSFKWRCIFEPCEEQFFSHSSSLLLWGTLKLFSWYFLSKVPDWKNNTNWFFCNIYK